MAELPKHAKESIADLSKMKNSTVQVTLGMLAPMLAALVEAVQKRDLLHRSLAARLDKQAQQLSALQKELAALRKLK